MIRIIDAVARQLRSSADSRATGPDMRLLRGVRWRLVGWSAGITLVILLVLGAAVYLAVARSLAAGAEQQLRDRAVGLGRIVEEGFGRGQLPIGFAFGGPGSGTLAIVVPPSGQVIAPSELTVEGLPDQAGVAAARAGSIDVRQTRIGDIPVRIVSVAVDRGGATYVVQVIGDRTAEERTLGSLLIVLLVGGLAALALALVGGWIYARRALVPIRESLRRQREFAADASHELRTPLAVIASSVEDLERHRDERVTEVGDALRDIRAEVDRVTALVGDLLLLARTDSGAVEIEKLPHDLADVATDALGSLSQLATERQVSLVLDPQPSPVLGDPLRLRQLVTILADNAIAHSPKTGTVTVYVRAATREATLMVEDEGPGIRPEDVPRVFDRFWRAPGAPSGGTGLGLAIAAWIVERHGGSIEVTNREEGGARFTVRLPAGSLGSNSSP